MNAICAPLREADLSLHQTVKEVQVAYLHELLTPYAWLFLTEGAIFYLLNKYFRWRAQRTEGEMRRLNRIWGWAVFIVGLPGIVLYLAIQYDWIFAGLELFGLPAMSYGLRNEIRRTEDTPLWVENLPRDGIMIGLGYSLCFHHGLTHVSQIFELGAAAGFLYGSSEQKKLTETGQGAGYLWFMVMHASSIALFIVQPAPLLMLQQLVSIALVADSYRLWRKQQQKSSLTRSFRSWCEKRAEALTRRRQ